MLDQAGAEPDPAKRNALLKQAQRRSGRLAGVWA